MNGILIYVLIGGIFFLLIFIILSYVVKKLKQYFNKKYLPETATSFKCIDGHIVRSKAELIIDNFLYNQNITHEYEKKIKVQGKSMLYDWYLPEFEVYIEYWGFYGKDYMKRKEEKIRLYKKGKLKLISIEDIMFKDIYENLEKLLKQYTKLNSSKSHCPNCGWMLDERF
jgi:predicted nuclease of restriction endonuclease-like RecB superfamily